MGRRKTRLRLGARDREILQYIGEQRMSWLLPLHHRFYRDREMSAVKSTMRRLTGRPPTYRYVQPDSLDGKRTCYRLTSESARMLGFPASASRPLGRTALIRRYAIQWFIEVDGSDERWLCDPREYPDLFSAEAHRLPRANFYIEQVDDENRFGFIVEDFGSDARRISRRAIDHLDRFLERRWFDELIAAERFAISFLTITAGKAKSLERQFQRGLEQRLYRTLKKATGTRTPVILTQFLVVPGLVDLLPSPQKTRAEKRHA